eukprot:TRINITY_DN27804_c0_g1_i1.p1 TRINITY_DN27804_c0_g1~~TRINITY_DN27804_c0_g1_i1.p1  ORF type:complete len:701 (+),score=55.93 TRINITY_DN27804_c0_g1_i1:49-2103(+)
MTESEDGVEQCTFSSDESSEDDIAETPTSFPNQHQRLPNREPSMRPYPQRLMIQGCWTDVWPELWGITISQVRALVDECREDPRWSHRNTVRDLVRDYITPRTAGQGLGYALMINARAPKEVNTLISHSWNENAEEFLETLERTVRHDDVMFICALSIYQNEDGAGPSISQQIGCSTKHSPFGRILRHIQQRGREAGFWWWPRGTFGFLPLALLLGAFQSFMLSEMVCGGIPCSDVLIVPVIGNQTLCTGWRTPQDVNCYPDTWQKDSLPTYCRPFFPLMMILPVSAVLALLLLRTVSRRVYRGRMVAVPNHQDNLYGRLWCVYEIFMACQLQVYVQLGRTLAKVGQCRSKEAQCSDPADDERIRREIESFGAKCCRQLGRSQDSMKAANEGYRRVDRAIQWTTSRSKREWVLITLRITLLGVSQLSSTVSLAKSLEMWNQAMVVGYLVAFFCYMALVWTVLRSSSYVTRTHLSMLVLLPCVLGLLLFAVSYLMEPGSDSHLIDVPASIGLYFIAFGFSGFFLPLTRIRKFGGNWRTTFLVSVGVLTWLAYYVAHVAYLSDPYWSLRLLDMQFPYASVMHTLAVNAGFPLLACYVWRFLLLWGVQMRIMHKEHSITENVMQSMVDVRANSLVRFHTGLRSVSCLGWMSRFGSSKSLASTGKGSDESSSDFPTPESDSDEEIGGR